MWQSIHSTVMESLKLNPRVSALEMLVLIGVSNREVCRQNKIAVNARGCCNRCCWTLNSFLTETGQFSITIATLLCFFGPPRWPSG